MKSFFEMECECKLAFEQLGECHHLWTPEDFEIIFVHEEDFKAAMGLVAICALLFPDVKILTFEIMSNHLHLAAATRKERLIELFEKLKSMLVLFTRHNGKTISWNKFIPGVRQLTSLEDLRNVIVYVNRNGFLVHPEDTPFSYLWGANKYYFNPDAQLYAKQNSIEMGGRQKRLLSHSHCADTIKIMCVNGYANPLCFCAINEGESLFRDASNYLHLLTRNIESNKKIACEIGERIFYNDDELYSAIYKLAKEKYNATSPATASASAKMELARTMKYDYNASSKQIIRILKLTQEVLASMGLA